MILLLVLLHIVILETAYTRYPGWYQALWATLPLLGLAFYGRYRIRRSAVKKNRQKDHSF